LAQCITCGAELHPERAEKYNYCMSPGCQEKNLKGVTMVAVGVNKAAEQYMLLDDQTRDELASGKFHDQRRGSFGTSVSSSASAARSRPGGRRPSRAAARRAGPSPPNPPTPPTAPTPPAPPAPRRPWTAKQERLALLYNEQGMRPEEIAQKLGLSPYTATQIILSSRNRGKL
jgi:DNA-binding CsgD family transcriptional regulator